ncbi:MAG: PAS domain S-box protein [Planctomycetota bacterium]
MTEATRPKSPRTLQQKILWRVFPIAIIALLAIVWLTRNGMERAIRDEASIRLQQNAQLTAARISDQMLQLRGFARTLAANDLIINSVVDRSQREGQLTVFLRSLKLPNRAFRRVTMADYRGRPLVSSTPDSDVDTSETVEVVMGGKEYFTANADTILVAAPVLYAGRPEAIVAVEYDSDALLQSLFTIGPSEYLQLSFNGGVIYQSNTRIRDDRWVSASTALNDDDTWRVQRGERADVAYASLNRLSPFFIGVIATFVTGLLAAIALTSRIATRPVGQLVSQIRSIEDTNDLSGKVDVEDTKEFQDLGSAFNRMIASLDQKTVSLEQLQAAESRLRTVFESVSNGLVGTDTDGTITLVNSSLEHIFGYDREDLLGRSIDIIVPDASQRTCLMDRFNDGAQPVQQGTVDRQTLFGLRNDGVQVPVEVGLSLVQWETGPGIIASVDDISRRYEQEKDNERLRHETQMILDSIPALVVFKDTENQIVRVNKAAAEVIGAPVSDIEGKHSREFFAEHEQYYQDDLAVMQAGIPKLGIVESVTTRGNETRWASTDKIPIYDRHDHLTGIIAVINDITALKRTEDQLAETTRAAQQNAERLRYTVESARIGLWDWDVNSTYVRVSKELSAQLGEETAYESFAGWRSRVHPDDREETEQRVHMCLEGAQRDYEAEFRLRHRNGSYRWILARGRVVDADDRGPQRMIGVHIDITDRQEDRQQLEKLNQELQRSNEELAQFAYVASHDLQEPLRKVTSFCELLKEELGDTLNDDCQRFIHYITDGAYRMRMLIQDLLAFSRIESQGTPTESVDLNTVVEESLENLSASIAEADASICTEKLPTVQGDALQLVQLFQNLIGNALKYRSDHRPTIRLAARKADTDWIISVKDNGIGIDPRYHDQIFGVFKRLHTMDTYQGTGIGLAICRRIAERLGGSIDVESREGQGSTFHVRLPE